MVVRASNLGKLYESVSWNPRMGSTQLLITADDSGSWAQNEWSM